MWRALLTRRRMVGMRIGVVRIWRMSSRRSCSVPNVDLSTIRMRRSGVGEVGCVGSVVERSSFAGHRISVRLIRGERRRGIGRGVAFFAVDLDVELLLANRRIDVLRTRRQGRSGDCVDGNPKVGSTSRGWRSLSSVVPGRSVCSPACILI